MKRNGVDVAYVECWILLNDDFKIILYADPVLDNIKDGYQVTGSLVLHLIPGDRVQVGSCANAIKINKSYHTYFSGMLVRPDV